MKDGHTTKSFWDELPKPIIGLAPMEGYSDSAFRRTCKRVNPDIVTFTEFTSADGLHFSPNKLRRKLFFHPDEQPVIAQIFGKNEDTFRTAAKICEDMGFAGIDINMGCPSKKVVRSEHGVALRKTPDKAYRLIETLANATHLPVSVKTRLGWSDASDLTPFCVGAQNAGANMICIHARTYMEPYKVAADWDPVYEMKESVSIPVLGNGGITSLKDGLAKQKNLDGFLIAQATFGNPWIFSTNDAPLSLADKIDVMKDHAKWLIEHKGEEVGCREIRKHLLKYFKDYPNAKAFRRQCSTVQSFDEINSVLADIESLSKQDALVS